IPKEKLSVVRDRGKRAGASAQGARTRVPTPSVERAPIGAAGNGIVGLTLAGGRPRPSRCCRRGRPCAPPSAMNNSPLGKEFHDRKGAWGAQMAGIGWSAHVQQEFRCAIAAPARKIFQLCDMWNSVRRGAGRLTTWKFRRDRIV